MAIPFQHVADHFDASELNKSTAVHLIDKIRHHGQNENAPLRESPLARQSKKTVPVAVSTSYSQSQPTITVKDIPQPAITESVATAQFGSGPYQAGPFYSGQFGSVTIPAGQPLTTLGSSPLIQERAPQASVMMQPSTYQMPPASFQPATVGDVSPNGSYTFHIPSHATGKPQMVAQQQQALHHQQLLPPHQNLTNSHAMQAEHQRVPTANAIDARSGHSNSPAIISKAEQKRIRNAQKQKEAKKRSWCC